MPKFFDRIASEYKGGVAHQFLLHFNVHDLARDAAYGYLPMLYYLMEQLNASGCDLVVGYSPSQGLIWPSVERWKAVQKSLGFPPQEADKTNPPPALRCPINAKVVHWNLHEDKFIADKLPPGDELRKNLDALLHQGRAKVGVVLNFVEKIVPNAELTTFEKERLLFLDTFQHWAMDLGMRLQKHIVLLVTSNLAEVHQALTKNADMPTVEIPFPSYQERLEFIEYLMSLPIPDKPVEDTRFTTPVTLAPGISKEQFARDTTGLNLQFLIVQQHELFPETFARDTTGLNLFGIHDVALRAQEARKPITRELVQVYQRESVNIHSRGILEVVSTPYDLDVVGGMAHVVSFLQNVIAAIREGDLKRVPRGMLFLGPPGTGKTMIAQLLARYSEMAFVRLKSSREGMGLDYGAPGVEERVYERNLTFALNFIRALTPVIVFMDEIDRAGVSRGGMDAERHDSALPFDLLNAMSDSSLHGKVLWIGASNRPDLMDVAFRKRGVFDDKLIFLPPTEAERADVLAKLFKKHRIAFEGIDFRKIATDQYTKALSSGDLEIIVQRSYGIARRNNHKVVTESDLIQATSDFVPDYSPEMNEFMGLLALREVNSRSMIPVTLPPEFQSFVEGNQINKTKINQRLMALGGQLGLKV